MSKNGVSLSPTPLLRRRPRCTFPPSLLFLNYIYSFAESIPLTTITVKKLGRAEKY